MDANTYNAVIDWLNQHLTVMGSVASIVGLLVTIWIADSINDLSKKAAFQGRLPDHVRDVRATSVELTSLLSTDELDGDSAEITLRKSLSSILSLKRKAPSVLSARLNTLRKQIEAVIDKKGDITRDSIRKIYYEVTSLEEDLKNYQKDEKWRIK